MKPYLLDPFESPRAASLGRVFYDGHEALRVEDLVSPVSLADVIDEYEEPLRKRVEAEQAKWEKLIETMIGVAVKPTLLSRVGLPIRTEPKLREDEWFLVSDPAVLSGNGESDPYAWEYDTIDFKVRMDFGFATPPSRAYTPLPLSWSSDGLSRSGGPWWATVHEPEWTVPDG